MASALRKPITDVWGQSPRRGPGAKRLVRGQGAKPLKLKDIHLFDSLWRAKFGLLSRFLGSFEIGPTEQVFLLNR